MLELAPEFLGAHAYLGKTLLAAGKPEAALAMVQQEDDEATRSIYLPVVLQAVGRNVEAEEALRALIAQWADESTFYVAQVYAHRGDHDLAMQWLERAYQLQDQWLFEILGEHLFKSMANARASRRFCAR